MGKSDHRAWAKAGCAASFDEIGRAIGASPQRTWQIFKRAMRKLRVELERRQWNEHGPTRHSGLGRRELPAGVSVQSGLHRISENESATKLPHVRPGHAHLDGAGIEFHRAPRGNRSPKVRIRSANVSARKRLSDSKLSDGGRKRPEGTFLKTRIFRDPRLPETFPGCWKDKAWRRQYTKAYMRLLRETDYAEIERGRAASAALKP
jgi:hypothetical protein